jgi:signal transduction histidine kinase
MDLTAIPFWSMTGRMVGTLMVCARSATGRRRGVVMADALPPLEAVAVRLARSLENVALAERLMRAEKLAGLGQLAGGVAHALNNPLTAVLGFAELIAGTATEPRIRQDAGTIVREALTMRDTVQGLMHFWRPEARNDGPVAIGALLRELAAVCEEKLATRGVNLTVQVQENVPEIRGNAERLREVMEHLLNNAAQAIRKRHNDAEGSEIRITVSHDESALHVIVSDTGPGFEEPGKVFDPFYTTAQVGAGSGMGLSVCYGIVREHGGEISAFNLHPHGAAVVVELPIGIVVSGGVVMEEGVAV